MNVTAPLPPSFPRAIEDERRARAFLNLAEVVRLVHRAAANELHCREIVGLPTAIETVDEKTFDVSFSDGTAASLIATYLVEILAVDLAVLPVGREGDGEDSATIRITLPVLR